MNERRGYDFVDKVRHFDIRHDCFACHQKTDGTYGCVALKQDYCRNDYDCNFYKQKFN